MVWSSKGIPRATVAGHVVHVVVRDGVEGFVVRWSGDCPVCNGKGTACGPCKGSGRRKFREWQPLVNPTRLPVPVPKAKRKMMAHRLNGPIAERYWAKVDKAGQVHPVLGTACWMWLGNPKAAYGYILDSQGEYGTKGRHIRATRFAWAIAHGHTEIPEGMGVVMLHKCDNTRCVNPDHLEPGTQKDNIADALSKGRMAWQRETQDEEAAKRAAVHRVERRRRTSRNRQEKS
jgi:hypothetical protein